MRFCKKQHHDAWVALAKVVVENVGIHHPNYHYPIYVCTDGSKMGVGGYEGFKRSETIPKRLELGDNRRVAPTFFVCFKRDGTTKWPNGSRKTAEKTTTLAPFWVGQWANWAPRKRNTKGPSTNQKPNTNQCKINYAAKVTEVTARVAGDAVGTRGHGSSVRRGWENTFIERSPSRAQRTQSCGNVPDNSAAGACSGSGAGSGACSGSGVGSGGGSSGAGASSGSGAGSGGGSGGGSGSGSAADAAPDALAACLLFFARWQCCAAPPRRLEASYRFIADRSSKLSLGTTGGRRGCPLRSLSNLPATQTPLTRTSDPAGEDTDVDVSGAS